MSEFFTVDRNFYNQVQQIAQQNESSVEEKLAQIEAVAIENDLEFSEAEREMATLALTDENYTQGVEEFQMTQSVKFSKGDAQRKSLKVNGKELILDDAYGSEAEIRHYAEEIINQSVSDFPEVVELFRKASQEGLSSLTSEEQGRLQELHPRALQNSKEIFSELKLNIAISRFRYIAFKDATIYSLAFDNLRDLYHNPGLENLTPEIVREKFSTGFFEEFKDELEGSGIFEPEVYQNLDILHQRLNRTSQIALSRMKIPTLRANFIPYVPKVEIGTPSEMATSEGVQTLRLMQELEQKNVDMLNEFNEGIAENNRLLSLLRNELTNLELMDITSFPLEEQDEIQNSIEDLQSRIDVLSENSRGLSENSTTFNTEHAEFMRAQFVNETETIIQEQLQEIDTEQMEINRKAIQFADHDRMSLDMVRESGEDTEMVALRSSILQNSESMNELWRIVVAFESPDSVHFDGQNSTEESREKVLDLSQGMNLVFAQVIENFDDIEKLNQLESILDKVSQGRELNPEEKDNLLAYGLYLNQENQLVNLAQTGSPVLTSEQLNGLRTIIDVSQAGDAFPAAQRVFSLLRGGIRVQEYTVALDEATDRFEAAIQRLESATEDLEAANQKVEKEFDDVQDAQEQLDDSTTVLRRFRGSLDSYRERIGQNDDPNLTQHIQNSFTREQLSSMGIEYNADSDAYYKDGYELTNETFVGIVRVYIHEQVLHTHSLQEELINETGELERAQDNASIQEQRVSELEQEARTYEQEVEEKRDALQEVRDEYAEELNDPNAPELPPELNSMFHGVLADADRAISRAYEVQEYAHNVFDKALTARKRFGRNFKRLGQGIAAGLKLILESNELLDELDKIFEDMVKKSHPVENFALNQKIEEALEKVEFLLKTLNLSPLPEEISMNILLQEFIEIQREQQELMDILKLEGEIQSERILATMIRHNEQLIEIHSFHRESIDSLDERRKDAIQEDLLIATNAIHAQLGVIQRNFVVSQVQRDLDALESIQSIDHSIRRDLSPILSS